MAGEARGAGALAPAEAFDARGFVERLEPLLALGDVRDGPRLPSVRWRRQPMTEAECYERCYGGPRRIEVLKTRPTLISTLTGEQIRRLFERRLDRREREAA